MSRTNPFKQKPRRARKAFLMVGEGGTEKAFLRFLKNLFLDRNGGISVQVEYAQGGSPDVVFKTAIKRLRGSGFEACLIVMDTDRAWPSHLPSRADRTAMRYVGCKPCIEALFLRILKDSGFSQGLSAGQCKQRFHEKYLDRHQKTDVRRYASLFPRQMLEEARNRCPELNDILNFLNGK